MKKLRGLTLLVGAALVLSSGSIVSMGRTQGRTQKPSASSQTSAGTAGAERPGSVNTAFDIILKIAQIDQDAGILRQQFEQLSPALQKYLDEFNKADKQQKPVALLRLLSVVFIPLQKSADVIHKGSALMAQALRAVAEPLGVGENVLVGTDDIVSLANGIDEMLYGVNQAILQVTDQMTADAKAKQGLPAPKPKADAGPVVIEMEF